MKEKKKKKIEGIRANIAGAIQPGFIYIFFGKMGSGKSTNAAAEIRRFARAGRPVWVNFPISKAPEGGAPAGIWRADHVEDLMFMKNGLYVIDEAYMELNSRNWATLKPEVFQAMTHVRKRGMTVIVIAQSWKRIDVSIREIAARARKYEGGRFGGSVYPFTEYEIDEAGEIIKNPIVEERKIGGWFRLVAGESYELFDSWFVFGETALREWPSAISTPPSSASS